MQHAARNGRPDAASARGPDSHRQSSGGSGPAHRHPGEGPDSADARSDAELLLASRTDPEAFGEVYRRNVEAVLAWSYRRTGCPETAADLTAETFAQAFLSRRRYRSTGVPGRAWLFGIARNELGRLARRGRVAERARRKLRVEPIALDDASLGQIESLVDFEPLRQAMTELSPNLSKAVLLRVGYELPYDEIARRLGCSAGAARVRVVRGLQQLSTAMREDASDHEPAQDGAWRDRHRTVQPTLEGAS